MWPLIMLNAYARRIITHPHKPIRQIYRHSPKYEMPKLFVFLKSVSRALGALETENT